MKPAHRPLRQPAFCATARQIGRPAAATLALALVTLLCSADIAPAVSDPQLQARVDRLLADIERSPTVPENTVERAHVLWDWANAVSLERGFTPINLTQVLRRLLNPPPGSLSPPRAIVSQLDDYARRLALIDDPGALGTLTIDGPPAAVRSSRQTYRVTYTVGRVPVRAGGRFLIARQFQSGTEMQIDDPSADGFVSISSSRAGASFEPTAEPISGPHGGFRGGIPMPAYRLVGADLEAGDRVTITYGDTTGGGRGMLIGEFSNDAVSLPLYVDHGDGLFHELPGTPTFRVVGGEAAGVHGFSESIAATGETVVISVRTEDDRYNRATGPIPAYEVLLDGEPYGEIPAAVSELADDYAGAIHALEVRFDQPGVYRFTFRSKDNRSKDNRSKDHRSKDGAIEGRANPILVEDDPQLRLYWGETHGHCGFAEGLGTPDGFFSFGRDDARLDFVTLSEHDIWMDDREWKVLNDAVAEWSEDGRYIVFPGYEWTSPRDTGGHHNVFFRRAGMERVPTQEAPVLSELYRGLYAKHDPADVLVIPHAHQAGDWRLSDLGVERLIEIVSGHGTFEWFGRYYLESGYQVGFVGASDDHLGHPGYSPGRSFPPRRSNIFQFGGLAGAFAPEKTHDAIFDSLRARHAYATSDAERIVLLATLNGEGMGTSMDDSEQRELSLRAIGTAPIETITVLRNNEEVHVESYAAGGAGDGRYQLAFESDSQPFIRDNPRGHRIWRGTLTVEGAEIESATLTGKINPSADSVTVDGSTVRFDLATRGGRRTFDLVLRGVTESARVTVELEPTTEAGRAPALVRPSAEIPGATFAFPVGELGGESVHELSLGRYRDTVRLRRLRDELRDDVTFTWSDRDPGPGGDWYSVRVRQIDGATAWSSPWWVGAQPPR